MQKNDILDELEDCRYIDKELNIIESLDSHWLSKESQRIKNRVG